MQARDIEKTVTKLRALPPERIMEVNDFIDFLHLRSDASSLNASSTPLDFPVDEAAAWPNDMSLRREDMYGDEGR